MNNKTNSTWQISYPSRFPGCQTGSRRILFHFSTLTPEKEYKSGSRAYPENARNGQFFDEHVSMSLEKWIS